MNISLNETPNSLTLGTAPIRTWVKDKDGYLWYRTGTNFAVRMGCLLPNYERNVDVFNFDRPGSPLTMAVSVLPSGSEITITV